VPGIAEADFYRIGFDVGGTFTDFTIYDAGRRELHHHKVPSTPHDPSEAIETGLAEIIRRWDIPPGRILFIGHGTTVATNMVIERRGVKTGLLTTQGTRDVIEIGRQLRPHLYDYAVVKPEPLVPRERRIEVAERLDASGATVTPLDPASLARAVAALMETGVAAVAICFLHSYKNAAHERAAAEAVRAALPDAFVSVSSEILPEFREYERQSTTVINAYIGPRMARYLDRFTGRIKSLGIAVEPLTVHSNGGLMSIEAVRDHPVRTCLSGPAAGVVGASVLGKRIGMTNLITFDAGGTSTDVSLIDRGEPAFTSSRLVAGYPVRTPMIDVQVIGAGGGSIAWIDDAGALKVGPHSAGSDPGPVAYGRGGTEVTLTDANIVLHRLNPTALLKGRMPVDEAAARAAVETKIARPLGLGVEEAALGIVRIAVANMSRAIRSVSTERGHNVEEFALMAFGGAGPLHAVDVADECSIPTVLVPVEPGTLCARGILLSDVSFDFVRSALSLLGPESWPQIAAAFDRMRREGAAWLERERIPADRRSLRAVIEARYVGQNFEVPVPVNLPLDTSPAAFAEDFASAHRREYGYDIPGRPVEIVNCRLKAVGAVESVSPPPGEGSGDAAVAAVGRRAVYFDGGRRDATIYDRDLLPVGARIDGPAVIEEMSATTVLAAGQRATVDPHHNLILDVRRTS
jgi:N-methylhydantoinase A